MTLRQAQGRSFGDTAQRLCGLAATLLGWRPGDFWNATPAELATALNLPEAAAPEREVIEELRRRFPD